MNVRKMMAMLNPRAPRLDGGGRGGVPTITPQDVAAALGAIPDPLAREVFIRVWWPDGAQLSVRQIQQAFADRLLAEVRRRDEALRAAKEQVARLEHARGIVPPTAELDADMRRALARLDAARQAAWPWHAEAHQRVLQAVLHEVSQPNICPDCKGSGDVRVGEGFATCERCQGRGVLPVSDRQRAQWLGRTHKTYRETWWQPMYEWVFALVTQVETEAARAMRATLGDAHEPEPPAPRQPATRTKRKAA